MSDANRRDDEATPDPEENGRRDVESPPTACTIAVLEYLATVAGGAATATQLAERVGVTRSTCRAILATLVRCGYVMRDGNRGYTIGRGASVLGRAARERDDLLRVVTGVLVRLSEELSAGCSITAVSGDDLLVVERIGTPQQFTDAQHTGVRLPFVAPFGAVIAAFLPEVSAAAWLEKAGLDSEATATMRKTLTAVAADGYHATAISDQSTRNLVSVIDELVAARDLRGDSVRHAGLVASFVKPVERGEQLDSRQFHAATVSVPVFGKTGSAELAVVLQFADRCPSPGELHTIGARVNALMRSATALVHS